MLKKKKLIKTQIKPYSDYQNSFKQSRSHRDMNKLVRQNQEKKTPNYLFWVLIKLQLNDKWSKWVERRN